MTIEQIQAMVGGEQYDFLRTNPHIKDRLVFLTLGGSHAYGTNIETSDIDVRGCVMNSRSDILGMTNFEQFVNTETDTVVYGFNKLVKLLIDCNPNTIELLGCIPEHYLLLSDVGKQMIQNRGLFLSLRAANSFGGYATQQLRRLENALARDKIPPEKREEHILGAVERSLKSFGDRYTSFEKGGIELLIGDSVRDDIDKEVLCNIHIDGYPAREFSTLLNTLSSVVSSYDKLNHRNHKKDNAHLNKHAMHLIRLYMMCLDILEKGEINTYRGDDREFLLNIRGGAFQKEDGTYRPEFFELVSDYERRLDYAKRNTGLPKSPDMKKIEEFVMDVNYKSIDWRY